MNIANAIYILETNHETNDPYNKTRTGINIDKPSSSFQVGGTFAYAASPIDGGVNDSSRYNSSASLFAKSNVTLPPATSCDGRVYNIIYISGTVTITNQIMDAGVPITGYVLNSNPGSKRVSVQSYLGEWHIIASS